MNISGLLENLKTNIDTMSMSEIILGGLSTALLAMIVVFTILVLISQIIRIINTQPKEKKIEVSIEPKTIENVSEMVVEKDGEDLIENTELVATITAAIVAASGKNIVVRRISRTNNNKSNWEKTSNI